MREGAGAANIEKPKCLREALLQSVDRNRSDAWPHRIARAPPRPAGLARLHDAFALLLPAHKGVASRVSAHFARAILLSANRVIVDDMRMMQFR